MMLMIIDDHDEDGDTGDFFIRLRVKPLMMLMVVMWVTRPTHY